MAFSVPNALLRISLVLAMMLGLAACSDSKDRQESPSDGMREIVFLTMQLRPTFDEYFLPLFERYEEANPGVKIVWLDAPYPEYETKLLTSFLAGREADVINIPSESLQAYVDKGLFLRIDKHLPRETLDKYIPTLINDGCTYRGGIHALPWYTATPVMFVNTAILEEAGIPADPPPSRIEDLPDICRQVRDRTGKFALFPIYTEVGSLRGYLWEAGVPLLSEDGNSAAFNTPRGAEVFEFWTDLYKDKLVPSESLVATHRRPIEYFKAGQLAMLITGPQFIRNIKSDAPDIYRQTTVAPLMHWEGQERIVVSLHILTVSATTRHPDLACDFAAYVTNTENQLDFCKRVTILPTTIAALDDPYFLNTEDTLEGNARRISAMQMKHSTVFPALPNSRMLYRALDDITEDVATDKMSAAEGLEKAEETWNAILE